MNQKNEEELSFNNRVFLQYFQVGLNGSMQIEPFFISDNRMHNACSHFDNTSLSDNEKTL